jgi:hypothetical protein
MRQTHEEHISYRTPSLLSTRLLEGRKGFSGNPKTRVHVELGGFKAGNCIFPEGKVSMHAKTEKIGIKSIR